jgi:tRNA threonylcarbamoyladenosine biosynthesis protein TsaE
LEGAVGGRVVILPCGPERAEDVHRLTQAVFRAYATLDPPSGALRESIETLRADLEKGGGAIAAVDGVVVGCLRWQVEADGNLRVRRVAVEPDFQRRGLGSALMAWAEDHARRQGRDAVSVGVRIALPGNLAFYGKLGYEVVGEHRHEGYDRTTWLALRKQLSKS